MPNLKDKIDLARSHGYSEKDINDYLSQSDSTLADRIKTARGHSYGEKEINDYLSMVDMPKPRIQQPANATSTVPPNPIQETMRPPEQQIAGGVKDIASGRLAPMLTGVQNVAQGVTGLALSPLTAATKGIEQVPIVGKPLSWLVNAPFQAIGEDYNWAAQKVQNGLSAIGLTPEAERNGLSEIANLFGQSDVTQEEYSKLAKTTTQTGALGTQFLAGKMAGDIAKSNAPTATDAIANKSLKAYTDAQNLREAQIKSFEKGVNLATPATGKFEPRVRPQDIRRSAGSLKEQQMQKPVTTVREMYDATGKAIKNIQSQTASLKEPFKDVIMPTNDIYKAAEDAIDKGRYTEKEKADALQSLQDLGIKPDGKLSVPDLEEKRVRLNTDTSPLYKSGQGQAIQKTLGDAEVAAKKAAATKLREQLYDKYEQSGVTGIKELRQTESSLIRLRDASERNLGRSERQYPPMLAKGIKYSPRFIGFASATLAHALGVPVVGDMAAYVLGEYLTDVVKDRWTPNPVTERAFSSLEKANVAPPKLGMSGDIPKGGGMIPTPGLKDLPPGNPETGQPAIPEPVQNAPQTPQGEAPMAQPQSGTQAVDPLIQRISSKFTGDIKNDLKLANDQLQSGMIDDKEYFILLKEAQDVATKKNPIVPPETPQSGVSSQNADVRVPRTETNNEQTSIPPSFRNQMMKKLGVTDQTISDADLTKKYQDAGLDKPADINEAPESRGGDLNVRGVANQAQVDIAESKLAKNSPITSKTPESAREQQVNQNTGTSEPSAVKENQAKEPWQMTKDEYVQSIGGEVGVDRKYPSHKKDVAEAIKQGKPVPPEVLKDYPDLQRSQTPPVQETRTTPKSEQAEPLTQAKVEEGTPIQRAQQARTEKLVAKAKPSIDADMGKGWKPEVKQLNDNATRNKLQQEYETLLNVAPFGNKNHPQTIRMNELKAQLGGDIKKTVYRLVSPDGQIKDLSKTEYDYAKSQSQPSPTTKGKNNLKSFEE